MLSRVLIYIYLLIDVQYLPYYFYLSTYQNTYLSWRVALTRELVPTTISIILFPSPSLPRAAFFVCYALYARHFRL